MVLKYFTDGDFRFHSYILKEKVRQCKEKVQTLTESHDLHQSGVATFFMAKEKHIFPGVGVMCFKWHPSVQGGFAFAYRSRYSILKRVSVALRSIALLRLQQRTEPV